jgi:short-subunit dehydrogenase involved in D-alanine esterification of teichoic acids
MIFLSIMIAVNLLASFFLASLIVSYINSFEDAQMVILLGSLLAYTVANAVAGFVAIDRVNDSVANQVKACEMLVIEMASGDSVCVVEGGPNISYRLVPTKE